MKVQVVGLHKKTVEHVLRQHGPELVLTDASPDVILCYGGDGTLLFAERNYPGIPKALIRHSRICAQCATLSQDTIIRLLRSGEYVVQRHVKLEAQANGVSLLALNDVIIGHPRVNGTIRARVKINGHPYGEEVLGDGVVVSTPIGSTAYYQSITRSNFQSGIGVAFNNAVNVVSHLVLNEQAVVEIEITRGPGIVSVDNSEEEIPLSKGDRIRIQAAKNPALIVQFPEEFQRFSISTGSNRFPYGYCQLCRSPFGMGE